MERPKFLWLKVLLLLTITNECFCKRRNYDNFDIEKLLSDPVKSKNISKCLKDEALCTSEDRELKRDLIQMLMTGCDGCTETEKMKLKELKQKTKDDPKFRKAILGDDWV